MARYPTARRSCPRHRRYGRFFVAETVGSFAKPSAVERMFGSALVWLLRLGVGPSHMRVLEVRGRKSGKGFALPVDLFAKDGKLYFVAPRGYAQWGRNAAAAGAVGLRRGGTTQTY